MSAPLAYFLSWTCYGQRLHGDARGSVDREHNRLGTPLLNTDARRETRERGLMKGPKVTLSPEMREVSDLGVASLCDEKGWKLLACNVRSTHAHVVVSCREQRPPERVMAQLKARATRDLRRAGLAAADARIWTDHGSTRWINHIRGLYGAIAYVNEWQDGPKRHMLEKHRQAVRERVLSLKAYLGMNELPDEERRRCD